MDLNKLLLIVIGDYSKTKVIKIWLCQYYLALSC